MAAEVAAAEQLVAATDREQCRAVRDRLLQRRPLGDEVGRDQRLLAVLAAADVVEVVLAGTHLVAERQRRDVELVAAQRGAPRQHGDVAAVGVDVQVLRIEMPDADPHVRSQYGFAQPRAATIRCSSSMAV